MLSKMTDHFPKGFIFLRIGFGVRLVIFSVVLKVKLEE